ncbi:MAG: hypothetical protein JXA99_13590 [Candidatus Lokiarchaeota archaeon]|nr:hypothetical protein [Candidatus Lokiarchaeota archaeon]
MKLNKKSIKHKRKLQITFVVITLLIPSLAFVFTHPNLNTLNNNEKLLDLKTSANSESGYSVAIKQYPLSGLFLVARVIWINLDPFAATVFTEATELAIGAIVEKICEVAVIAIFAAAGISIPASVLYIPLLLISLALAVALAFFWNAHMNARGGDIKFGIGVQTFIIPTLYFYLDNSRDSVDNYDLMIPYMDTILYPNAVLLSNFIGYLPTNTWIGV